MAQFNFYIFRLFRTVRLIQSYGEYEFLSNGVYENYLHMKMKETGFKTVNTTHSICHGNYKFLFSDHLRLGLVLLL
jgi:hypothetical protein